MVAPWLWPPLQPPSPANFPLTAGVPLETAEMLHHNTPIRGS